VKYSKILKFLNLVVVIATLVIVTAPVIAQSPTLQMKTVQLEKTLTSQQQILEFSNQRKLLEPPEHQSKPFKVTTGVYISNLIDRVHPSYAMSIDT